MYTTAAVVVNPSEKHIHRQHKGLTPGRTNNTHINKSGLKSEDWWWREKAALWSYTQLLQELQSKSRHFRSQILMKNIKTTVLTEVWKTFIKSKLRLCTCSTSEALRLRAPYNSFSEMPLHVESCYPDTHLSLHHRQWLVTEVVLRNPNQQSLLVKHMLLHYALQPTYSFLYKSAVCPNEKKKHCVLSQVVTAQT